MDEDINLASKRVMVTGGTGFIGGQLVEKLLLGGSIVSVPYIELDKRSNFFLKDFSNKVTLEKVDITKKEKLLNHIRNNKTEYIFHLAAQTLVTKAYIDPSETLNVNIIGTINILEAARTMPQIKGVVIASSDKAYGKTDKAYSEEFPLRGDHPYDVSKSAADLIAQAYFKTYSLPIVITRFGNVYGEGDLHFERIIPGICEAVINKKPLVIRSNGKYVRDYIYVEDVVNGYLLLLKKINKTLGNAYNFSSQDKLTVLELVSLAEKVLKVRIPKVILDNAQNEIPYQHLDDTKIRSLGWHSKYNLEKILPKVLSWYTNIIK